MRLLSGFKNLFGSTDAPSSNVLETPTLRIVLPPDWKVKLRTSPISAVGPRGEVLKVTSFAVTGNGTPEELAGIRTELLGKLHRTIEATAAEPVFTEFSGVTEETLPSAMLLVATLKSVRGGFAFWQFGLLGASTALYANCQFPPTASSQESVSAAIRGTEWR
ncbi:hypothetical protein [Methyloversatilis universalis]|uniref:hypothetical protein n=1 Tax=Methyloversatilis universalis TaxID=378211 RepID=UPI0012FBD760|nr:hypothetical protein [Methyloversatilis universalis]